MLRGLQYPLLILLASPFATKENKLFEKFCLNLQEGPFANFSKQIKPDSALIGLGFETGKYHV